MAFVAPIILLGCASQSGDAPRGSEDSEPANAPEIFAETVPTADVPTRMAAEAPDATAPPLLSADFEPPSAACNGWRGDGTRTVRSVPAHSGDYGCRVCTTTDAEDSAIENQARFVPAGRYELTAWVRAHPKWPAPEGASVSIEARTASGTRIVSTPLVIGADYDEVTAAIDLDVPAEVVRVRVGALSPAKAGECILVDDVAFARVR